MVITFFHYTKSSILVFYPLIFFAIIYEYFKKDNQKFFLFKSALIVVLPFLLAFPWYLRNYLVYNTFFSMSTITGGSWYFVSSIQESILKILHMPYLFLFRMHFDPPKPMLSWFNIIPNLWLLFAGGYWIFRFRKILAESYSIQLINILLISMVGAYLYYALPTGYTEGRLLYPALPAILYFMTEVLFLKKLNKLFFDSWQILFVLLVFLPSYIIAFYL
jgi:glycosidase